MVFLGRGKVFFCIVCSRYTYLCILTLLRLSFSHLPFHPCLSRPLSTALLRSLPVVVLVALFAT